MYTLTDLKSYRDTLLLVGCHCHLKGGGGGGGSVRTEPSRQLLDDCTHKRDNKRKLVKPIHH